MDNLLSRINLSQNLSFKDFSKTLSNSFKSYEEKKKAFIVSFLAMLELIKNGVLEASQDENNHNEIRIQKQDMI